LAYSSAANSSLEEVRFFSGLLSAVALNN
jgi:hypothetical protein